MSLMDYYLLSVLYAVIVILGTTAVEWYTGNDLTVKALLEQVFIAILPVINLIFATYILIIIIDTMKPRVLIKGRRKG